MKPERALRTYGTLALAQDVTATFTTFNPVDTSWERYLPIITRSSP